MKRIFLLVASLMFIQLPAESWAAPNWPEFVDVDLNYRNSAPMRTGEFWDFRLGAGIESEPTFQGSDDSDTESDLFLLAAYRAHWGNVFLTGGGLGFSRMLTNNLGIQLQLELEDTREVGDDIRLVGLGEQDEELELEITGRYFFGQWQLGASLAAATGDKGVVWFAGGGYTWRLLNDSLFISLASDISGSDKDNQRTDFGITAEQSAASVEAYPVYTPDGGLKSFGLNLNADYKLSDRWYLYASIDAERFLGDVEDSPLIQQGGSEQNVEIGWGFYYRF